MNITSLTPSQLRQAASLKEKIETLQKQLAHLAGGTGAATRAASPAGKPVKTKKKISAAGIARIRAAQKARWAKIKAKAHTAKAPSKKVRRPLSAEARAKMAAAAKARWAKVRAAKAK